MSVVSLLAATAVMLQAPGESLTAQMQKIGYKAEAGARGPLLAFYRETPEMNGGGQQGASQASGRTAPARMTRQWAQLYVSKEPATPAWKDLPNIYHTESVYLGTSSGLHVYMKGPLFDAVCLLKTKQYADGEAWPDLAIKGVAIEDFGTCTANTCIDQLSMAGDDCLPALMESLKASPKASWQIIRAIGNTRGPGSTKELIQLYRSGREEHSKPAAYALIHAPLRPEAKQEYFDMVERGAYVQHLSPLFAQVGWKDAVPSLLAAIEAPQHPLDLVRALEAERDLTGKPISKEVKEAFSKFFSATPERLQKLTATLSACKDKQALAAYAYALTHVTTKSNGGSYIQGADKLMASVPADAAEWVRKKFRDED